MSRMDVERMAEDYALRTFLSAQGDTNYDELMEALNNNEVPDDIVIWEPFAGYSCDLLMFFIEGLRNEYLTFADKVRGS